MISHLHVLISNFPPRENRGRKKIEVEKVFQVLQNLSPFLFLLHISSKSLHPKPCTLDPKRCTLNPSNPLPLNFNLPRCTCEHRIGSVRPAHPSPCIQFRRVSGGYRADIGQISGRYRIDCRASSMESNPRPCPCLSLSLSLLPAPCSLSRPDFSISFFFFPTLPIRPIVGPAILFPPFPFLFPSLFPPYYSLSSPLLLNRWGPPPPRVLHYIHPPIFFKLKNKIPLQSHLLQNIFIASASRRSCMSYFHPLPFFSHFPPREIKFKKS